MFSFWSVPTFEQQNASWDGCRPVMRLTKMKQLSESIMFTKPPLERRLGQFNLMVSGRWVITAHRRTENSLHSLLNAPVTEPSDAVSDDLRSSNLTCLERANIPCQSAVSCKLNFTHSNSRATNVSSIQFSSVPWPIWSSGEYEGLCQLWAKGRLWRETFGARSLVLPDALVRQHCAGSKTRTKELVLGRFDLKRRKFHDFSPVVELCQYWSVC